MHDICLYSRLIVSIGCLYAKITIKISIAMMLNAA